MRLKTNRFRKGGWAYNNWVGLLEQPMVKDGKDGEFRPSRSNTVKKEIVEQVANKTVTKFTVRNVDIVHHAVRTFVIYLKVWQGRGNTGLCQVYVYGDKDVLNFPANREVLDWDAESLLAYRLHECLTPPDDRPESMIPEDYYVF